ncbi:MAG: AAA family ATPase, partial [Acetatifactor sp.]|nr:AAA family ATPase [Acetatifactor sp.]
MKIKRVECDQFAGVQGRELAFDNGLNIVVGDNESGKSTMVDLIYQILFKDVKLDGRSDSDFMDKYFPKKVSGPQGDVIDGVLVFETANGTYKLKKEWEKGEGSCRLTLPDGTSIKGDLAVNEVLAGELKHRAGVYNEIVFASQKRNQIAVESIMRVLSKKTDSLSETRADLTDTLTQVSLETGGVSLEKIEKTLKENMNYLIGRWDRSADAPEGGAKRATYKNAWTMGAGLVGKAYYEMDRVRDMQTQAEDAERAV